MKAHLCVRVYANGEAKHTIRDSKGLESWLEYNRMFRPGNALFVDGVLPDPTMDRGYLSEEQIAQVSASLVVELAKMGPLTAWQPKYDHMERKEIYPDRGWQSFEWPQPAREPNPPGPGR